MRILGKILRLEAIRGSVYNNNYLCFCDARGGLGSLIGGYQTPWWLLDRRILRYEGFDVNDQLFMLVGGYQT